MGTKEFFVKKPVIIQEAIFNGNKSAIQTIHMQYSGR